MHIDIITLFPEVLESIISHSILLRSQKNGIVTFGIHNLRDYATNNYHSVDDYQYGGGAGMVMQIEPIDHCLQDLKKQRQYDDIIYTSPDGGQLCQPLVNEISMKENLCILCGHYKGIDQRVRDHLITREISIGDYVLSGGELAAGVIADAIVRVIPGVLNDETSALTDSFQDGLLSAPVYTRPEQYNGWRVPEVLLSGNDKLISQWRDRQREQRTMQRRKDLLE